MEFPTTKVPRHYIYGAIYVTNWYMERGGGGGSAHARSAQTVNAYVLIFFVACNAKSSV